MRGLKLFVSAAAAAGLLSSNAWAATPKITSVVPSGSGSPEVIIRGRHLGERTSKRLETPSVTFGTVPAPGNVTFNSTGTEVTVLVPPGTGTVDVRVSTPKGGTSALTPADRYSYGAPSGGHWLGLNGNSQSNRSNGEWLGPVNLFAKEGIVYDRSLEITAGQLPHEVSPGGTPFESTLQYDHEYGMVPLVVIDYRGYVGDYKPDPYFPAPQRSRGEEAEGRTTVAQYAEGFARTAAATLAIITAKYPSMPVYFEAMNEPWGYTTPQYNGAQYAPAAAAVLSAAGHAGVPLGDILLAATGADQSINGEGRAEWHTAGWIPAMYGAAPSLATEAQGWYFHPYGPPTGSKFNNSSGIESVAQVHKLIRSGAGNIFVSEDGFCARRVGLCAGGPLVESSGEAAKLLSEMLTNALPDHEAGWLKALIVYSRTDGGWRMQEYPSKELNASGRALDEFARLHG